MGLTTENNDMTIKESIHSLEDMIGRLKDEDISLEESFELYENGMKLLKSLNEKIDTVEKKMQVIAGSGQTEEFE